MIQTEYDFTLPMGYESPDGTVCKKGSMRLSTARDEIEAMKDPRGRQNYYYFMVLLLSRVIVRLEGVEKVTPLTIERMCTKDFSFLKDMCETINDMKDSVIRGVECPHCGKVFDYTLNFNREEWQSPAWKNCCRNGMRN